MTKDETIKKLQNAMESILTQYPRRSYTKAKAYIARILLETGVKPRYNWPKRYC